MFFFDKISLSFKLKIIVSSVLIIIFTIISVFLYNYEINRIENQSKLIIEKEINEISKIIDQYEKKNKEKTGIAIKVFENILEYYGEFVETDTSTINVNIINKNTNEELSTTISTILLDDVEAYDDFEIVDNIQRIANVNASIYQKIPTGYLCISTNYLNSIGKRQINTYIPNSSLIVETIERGDTYSGKINYLNKEYFVIHKPFYIDGKIRGIYEVGVKNKLRFLLDIIYNKKKFFNSQYIYILNKKGDEIYKPKLLKEYPNSKLIYEKIRKSLYGYNSIIFEEEINNINTEYVLNFIFDKRSNNYICIIYHKDEYSKSLSYLKFILLFVFIGLLISIYIISIIVNPYIKKIKKLSFSINEFSIGNIPKKINFNYNDELGKAVKSLNIYTDHVKDVISFSQNISKGNINAEIVLKNKSDVLVKSLINIRDNIISSIDEKNKREISDEINNWTNDGVSKFIEIQRNNSTDEKKLSYAIISNLVNYLNANQGALFFIEKKEDETVIVQKSSYAFNKERYVNSVFSTEIGLLGRVYKERKTILITDIPKNYITITSGLGEEIPNSLAIVPLIFNNNIHGIVEIASFNNLKEFQLKFIEKIGVNIAATISNVKVNRQTSVLLEQSVVQSKIMQTQEEEMAKSYSILQKLQDDVSKKENEMNGILDAVNSTTLVAEFDQYGKILKINDLFLELFKIKREDIIGKHYSRFIHSDKETFELIWNDLRHGKERQFTGFVDLPDERKLWLYQTYTPILDNNGNLYKILAIVADLTESKLIENKLEKQTIDLKAQEKELRNLLENSIIIQNKIQLKEQNMSAIMQSIDKTLLRIEYDTKGRILYANKKYLKITEYKLNEIKGSNVRDGIPSNRIIQFNKNWQKVLKGESIEGEITISSKKGGKINLLKVDTPIHNETGAVVKVLFIAIEKT